MHSHLTNFLDLTDVVLTAVSSEVESHYDTSAEAAHH